MNCILKADDNTFIFNLLINIIWITHGVHQRMGSRVNFARRRYSIGNRKLVEDHGSTTRALYTGENNDVEILFIGQRLFNLIYNIKSIFSSYTVSYILSYDK